MRYLILFFSFIFLFADIKVFIPKHYDIKLPGKYKKVYFDDVKKIDLNNSLAIVSYENIPWILEKNVTIITPIENLKEYIVSKVPLDKITILANPTLSAKVLLKALPYKINFIKIPQKEFFYSNIDAVVTDKKIEGFYNYDISKLGVGFNKYFLISTKKFALKHKREVDFLNFFLLENYKTSKSRLFETLILSAYYLDKKIDICSKLFYRCDNKILNPSKVVKVSITPTWPPFNMYENNELKGIGIDLWKLIAKKANIKYTFELENNWLNVLNAIKTKKADLTPNTSKTPDREKFAIFSKPYIEFPLAIICKRGLNIDNIKDIKSIAVGYNYTAHKLMKKHYPNLHYIPVKTTKEALEFVKSSKAECAVDILPTIIWYVNKFHYINMDIVKTTDFKFKLQVMIRKDLPELKVKIDKAIDKITPQEKNEIINKYIGIKIKNKNHNVAFSVIVIIILVLLVLVGYKMLKYRKEANIDMLTGILNRGAIEKKLRKLAKKAEGSVIFFDIDHFKNINDTYGHEFGDYVLQNLSKLIKESIRSSDYFGRWGGEEFLIILPDTSYENALKIAEKLRKKIAVHSFKNVKITSSFGVTEFKRGESVDNIMARADEALYEAKESGRNQVKGKK
jgi:polar amino acid transport system substrate-binding protein